MWMALKHWNKIKNWKIILISTRRTQSKTTKLKLFISVGNVLHVNSNFLPTWNAFGPIKCGFCGDTWHNGTRLRPQDSLDGRYGSVTTRTQFERIAQRDVGSGPKKRLYELQPWKRSWIWVGPITNTGQRGLDAKYSLLLLFRNYFNLYGGNRIK